MIQNSYSLEKHFFRSSVKLRSFHMSNFKEALMKNMRRNWLFLLFTALLAIGLVQVSHAAEKKEKKMTPALEAPAGSAGGEQNAQGIQSYNQKDWKEAEKHFREAVKADDKLAEAHYNLGLALNRLGRHKEATPEFTRAAELAPSNSTITSATTVKSHDKQMKKQEHDKTHG